MDTGALLAAAADGDAGAWNALVDRYASLVWSVARAHRLADADAADVSQTVWLRLVEHLDRVRDPDALGAWLATCTRRECLRALRLGARELPTDDERRLDAPAEDRPLAGLEHAERTSALWRAFERLGTRCQELLRVLMADPAPSYEEVGAALGMPIGAIGPTRGRCLEQLRRHATATGLQPAEA